MQSALFWWSSLVDINYIKLIEGALSLNMSLTDFLPAGAVLSGRGMLKSPTKYGNMYISSLSCISLVAYVFCFLNCFPTEE